MRFRQVFAAVPFCLALVSTASHAAFPVPEACKTATIDVERYERDAILPPACVENRKCGSTNATEIADWFDAISKQLAAKLSAIPNYYPGNTQNELCTGVFAIYSRIGMFEAVEFDELTPARHQLIAEAIDHAVQTAERENARYSMSRSELAMAKRKDRAFLAARREARAAADARVQQEDKAKAAEAAAHAKAKRDTAMSVFQNKVMAALLSGAQQGFIIDQNTMRSPYNVQPDTTLTDLMMWAISDWHMKRESDTAEDTFQPPEKDEFETTAQYEERVKAMKAAHIQGVSERERQNRHMLMADLDDRVASATGGFKVHDIRYDADNQRFTVDIRTGNGVHVGAGHIAVPLDVARAAKSKLEAASLLAGFTATGNALKLSRFVLVNQDNETPAESEIHPIEFKPLQFDLSPAPAAAWRQAHEAEQQERIRQAEAADLAKRKRIAESHPYQARFSCNLGQLYICLGNDGGISIRSGAETSSYTAHDLAGSPDLEVFLTKDFEIAAQTGGGNGRKMTLEIVDLVSGKTLYRETTAEPYAVIRVTD